MKFEQYANTPDQDKDSSDKIKDNSEKNELEKKYDKYLDIAYVFKELLPDLVVEKEGDDIIIKKD